MAIYLHSRTKPCNVVICHTVMDVRGEFMASVKLLQASVDCPGENLGLLANGSSGAWEVSIDETVSGAERRFAQIEGPSVCLYFEIPSPEIIARTIEFLLQRDSKQKERSEASSRSNDILSIGAVGETLVSLVMDNEYEDRCFIVVGRSDSPIVRFSIAGEDFTNLVKALCQVREDIRQSADSEETSGAVEHVSESKNTLASFPVNYVSLWSFTNENAALASKLLNFMCKYDFSYAFMEQTHAPWFKDKEIRYHWGKRSPYVREIAMRLHVDSDRLKRFLKKQRFNPHERYNPGRPRRETWVEKGWVWV